MKVKALVFLALAALVLVSGCTAQPPNLPSAPAGQEGLQQQQAEGILDSQTDTLLQDQGDTSQELLGQ